MKMDILGWTYFPNGNVFNDKLWRKNRESRGRGIIRGGMLSDIQEENKQMKEKRQDGAKCRMSN